MKADINKLHEKRYYQDWWLTGNARAYELLSTGAEGIYQGKYELYDDEDMAKFILGLLLKG